MNSEYFNKVRDPFRFSRIPRPPPPGKFVLNMGAKFTLLIMAVLIGLTIVTIIYSVKHLRSSTTLGMKEMGESLGKVVGVASAYQGFFEMDNRKLNQYIDSAVSQPDVAYMAIIDAESDKIRSQQGLKPEEAEAISRDEPIESLRGLYQIRQDITLPSPLGKLGTVAIGISQNRIKHEKEQIIQEQIIIALLAMILAVGLIWFFARSITRPLRQLTRQTEAIGEGNLEERIRFSGHDEVGRLAGSVEMMRVNLRTNINRIAFLGRTAHSLNTVLSLPEVREELRRDLRDYPLWPYREVGLALIGRDIPPEKFHYLHVFPRLEKGEEKEAYYPLDRSVIASVIKARKPLERSHPSSVGPLNDFNIYLQKKEVENDLIIPLIVKSRPRGVLYVGFKADFEPPPELREIMQNIADETAGTIERVYLVEDLRNSLGQLKRVHQELKGVDDLKTEFISSVSHELRTPLVSMTGYLHMMLEEKLGKITSLQKEGLEVSVKSLNRLTGLIEKMLTFSSEHRQEELELSDFDIAGVIKHCIMTEKNKAAEKNIELRYSVEKETPPVRADEDKIIEVLLNLLDNALKFTPEGGLVEVKARPPFSRDPDRKDRIEVLVRDKGKGISSNDLKRIFNKFWQAPAEEGRKHKGIGLGLSLVKKIIDAHRCRIEVQSHKGEGTTFIFTLPIAPEDSVVS